MTRADTDFSKRSFADWAGKFRGAASSYSLVSKHGPWHLVTKFLRHFFAVASKSSRARLERHTSGSSFGSFWSWRKSFRSPQTRTADFRRGTHSTKLPGTTDRPSCCRAGHQSFLAADNRECRTWSCACSRACELTIRNRPVWRCHPQLEGYFLKQLK